MPEKERTTFEDELNGMQYNAQLNTFEPRYFQLPPNGFDTNDCITNIKLNQIRLCYEPSLGANGKAMT